MFKRFSAMILLACLLLSLLPANVAASEPAATGKEELTLLRNSDTETAHDGICWYADSMNGNVLTASRALLPQPGCIGTGDVDFEIRRLTDWPVDQLLWWDGFLLVSSGSSLLKLSPDSGEILLEGQPLDRSNKKALCGFRMQVGMIFQEVGDHIHVDDHHRHDDYQ